MVELTEYRVLECLLSCRACFTSVRLIGEDCPKARIWAQSHHLPVFVEVWVNADGLALRVL